MMKLFRQILIIVVFPLLGGCSLFFESPEATVTDVVFLGLDPGGVDIEILASVRNPNGFDIVLTGYTYDLQVNALPFADGGSNRKTRFPSRETTDVRLPVRIGFRSLYELLRRRPDPDRIPYRLTGTLIVDTPVGEQIIPFRRDDLFSIPRKYRPSTLIDSIGTFVEGLLQGQKGEQP